MPVGEGTASDTNQVPDASRLTPPRLLPGLHPGASLSLKVVVEAGGLLPARLGCSQTPRPDRGRRQRGIRAQSPG